MKRLLLIILALLFLLTASSLPAYAADSESNEIAIVFTHDLHSYLEPFIIDGKSVGGFAGIKTVIDNTKKDYENTLVLDGGDFSMGTLFQTVYKSSASEYRMLGLLGIEATTLGNHEFDYGFDGLKEMVSSANNSGDYVPPILCANIDKTASGITETDLNSINVKEYTIIQKGDMNIAVFGLIGRDAVECAPQSGLVFKDFVDAAKETVSEIKSLHSPDMIICLSHSGTGDSVNDEDIELANSVNDIDLIISAHTHTLLKDPIIANNTVIVSSGEYGRYVGKVIFNNNNGLQFSSYSLIEINDSVSKDKTVTDQIESYKTDISYYLDKFGYKSADQVIAYSPFEFTDSNLFREELTEQPLGNLISDSYIYSVKKAEGDSYVPIDVAVTPVGVIRSSLDKGNITVSKAFEISSLGIGPDGVAGYPLCSVYLTGRELWALAEVDASVSSLMSHAQLYCSGLNYSVNTNRMFLNRVYDCWLVDEFGNRIEIEDDKLYRVVSGLYSAQMLGTVNSKSYGLLKLTPKYENGEPITDFNKCVITDDNNVEIKEWRALADYLSSFPKGQNGIPTISSEYSSTQERKTVNDKFVVSEVFVKWNFITWIVLIAVVLIIAIIVLVIIAIVKRSQKRKKRRANIARSSEIIDLN